MPRSDIAHNAIMADTDTLPERKPRKSVAFADGQTVVDENGDVTKSHEDHPEDTGNAESHSKDGDVDKATDDFEALALGAKKKKKSSKPKTDGEDATAEPKGADEDGEVDLSALKKKKKKKPKAAEGDEFEAKLAEAGAGEDTAAAEEELKAPAETGKQEGDIIKGTGIWSHDETRTYNYESLLSRFFATLQESHPDLGGGGAKSYKIPPPQCLREGNKKTIFANIAEISKRMKRSDEHVTQFLFAELGTSGSVDGSRRLVIKGRFQQKQIENVLRRYIGKHQPNTYHRHLPNFTDRSSVEYVTCKTCRSPDTELNKGENRLYFVTCNSCGSRRSVTAIKTGFSAQVGKRKRQQG